jgi:FMN-dependent oxidoreductase (nitrilotriacetate monooxygenase family)
MTSDREHHARAGRRELVLGATVRTLGAWPSAWRQTGAHRDPRADPAALRQLAARAEEAGLHFLHFGDWLATSDEFEHTDPYLLARVDPFIAIAHLSAGTKRIGFIATTSSSHAEPYAIARAAAALDLLSEGRFGLTVTSGSEASSASNFGRSSADDASARIAAAGEFIEILAGLWDSWEDDAFVADTETGQLIDRTKLHTLGFRGRYRSVEGPLNAVRPPQGHPPLAVVGGAQNSRELAYRYANLLFVSPASIAEGAEEYAGAKLAASDLGRDPRELLVITPILPITAPTTEEAWAVYDDLVALVPVETVADRSSVGNLPSNRTIRSLANVIGVSLVGVHIDEFVPSRTAQRFGAHGLRLIQIVTARSGRTIGGDHAITYRHLLVAHTVALPIVVGSGRDIADHFQAWFDEPAVDGFTVLSANAAGFEAFVDLVIPELQARGIFPREYAGATLRQNLGLRSPANQFASTARTR